MFRSRSWFGGGGLWKPKNPHSLEHLKYLYNVLSKNQIVNDHNRSLLVETLRSIAEILIWGDQNDSTVFDFFLEKNMLSFFLKIMKQKCGSYVCVQLLQTLNILFENIRNETSLYYLLSNNHVNSIIVHKFDYSDEEVMAYYISFLKTLSLKLNSHTIHFFYNEHTHDFPLYTEAIKFFNNSESMVRIAVRTLTLNVYRVRDKSMLKFIRDKTAAPYFSNLVWFIGNHVFELDNCIRENTEHESRIKLADLAAEHLDHLHYLNDILCLEINDLNQVLTEHLLYRLFIPLYVCSLDRNSAEGRTRVSSILALFLLSQVFLILTHSPLVQLLSNILINGNESIYNFKAEVHVPRLSLSFESSNLNELSEGSPDDSGAAETHTDPDRISTESHSGDSDSSEASPLEKLQALENLFSQSNPDLSDLNHRSILTCLYESLDSSENDYAALFTLGLLHAMYDNAGINRELLDTFFHGADEPSNPDPESDRPTPTPTTTYHQFNKHLTDRLISIICSAVKSEGKVRIVTLQLLISLLLKIVMKNKDGENSTTSTLPDSDLALIEGAREENILVLQKYYSTDEMFLEIFEDEYLELSESSAKPTSIEHLMMDSSLLLPPAGTPMTGISFDKRLPCGEIERSRRAMRIYFLLRKLSLTLRNEPETYLPLTNTQNCVHIDDNLDLTNSDMLCCSVITRDNVKTRRYLVVDGFQLILVDPSNKKMGWGVVKFVGFLQDIEVLGDKDDSRILHITVKTSPTNQRGSQSKTPLLSAKFMFDDHIRCMAAKQRLVKGKLIARQRKVHLIGKLLDLAGTPPPPAQSQNLRTKARRPLTRADRGMFNPISKTLPGVAMPVSGSGSGSNSANSSRRPSKEQQQQQQSSPRPTGSSSSTSTQMFQQQEEEIPLGNIRFQNSHHSHIGATAPTTTTPSSFLAQGTHSVSSSLLRLGLPLPLPQSHQHQNQISNPNEISRQAQEFPKADAEPLTTPQSETSFMTLNSPITTTHSPIGSSSNSPVKSPTPNNSNSNANSNNRSTNTKKKGAIETV